MTPAKWISELFRCIDANDTEEFLSYLTHAALFRFGNAPAVQGQAAIRAAIEGFFASIKRSRHELCGHRACGDTVICQGEVTYTRRDAGQVTLPFVNIFAIEGERIKQYLIYIDISPLYAPAM